MSKSSPARKALNKAFAEKPREADRAAEWLVRWRGIMATSKSAKLKSDRVAHILAKHLL